MRYTLNDVESNIDPVVYFRGMIVASAGKVMGRTHSQNRITSQVMGRDNAIFHTEIELAPAGQPISFKGTCSCPVKRDCEHVAATLISSIRPTDEEEDLPAPQHSTHASQQLPRKWPFEVMTPSSRATPQPKQVSKASLTASSIVRTDVEPKPVLVLNSQSGFDYAQLVFDYDDVHVPAEGVGNSHIVIKKTPDGDERIQRNDALEKTYVQKLTAFDFYRPKFVSYKRQHNKTHPLQYISGVFELGSEATWIHFAKNGLLELTLAGWEIEKRVGYRFDISDVQDWYADIVDSVEGSGQAWFDFELGIEVDNERVSLMPVLIDLIKKAPDQFHADAIVKYADTDELLVTLPDNRRVMLPWGRIKPILLTLGELYFTEKEGTTVRLSTLDAARLAELDAAISLRWLGGERVLELGRKFKAFEHIEPASPPVGLLTELRSYQLEGLAWLQFLREYNLAGILADDMGLGKTLQTLAHVLTEKESGRLDRPAMVVAPTSLMDNWRDETMKFAPSLKVLVLHGNDRFDKFPNIAEYDLVLTTFGLLHRDEHLFRKHKFHLVVLDESQNIKNAKTLAAHTASLLDSRHRLCLTGTPMENHLGELWSQFNFLLPGLLGDNRAFNRDYRKPIEKNGDDTRRAFLVKRITPFLLRRTKDMVANELPPKEELVQHVEITGAQRDLYETVRLALDKKVRDEIAHKGVARSQIVILEALLKLRQVCCDPRLVKSLDKSEAIPSSAKLNELLTLLKQKVSEGRKVLVFSSFTTMLDLIGDELSTNKMDYVRLDGSTTNRGAVVKTFQEGDVPVFLISLKAGGVGLNLTAADTVIHYDPWWNPAAENQATDRAYRLGQDKEVTVYKLIARGTVEEKIQTLQQNKAELAKSILAGGKASPMNITQADLDAIFAPIGESAVTSKTDARATEQTLDMAEG